MAVAALVDGAATVMYVSPVDMAGLRERVEKALAAFLVHQRTLLAGIDPALDPVVATISSESSPPAPRKPQ